MSVANIRSEIKARNMTEAFWKEYILEDLYEKRQFYILGYFADTSTAGKQQKVKFS